MQIRMPSGLGVLAQLPMGVPIKWAILVEQAVELRRVVWVGLSAMLDNRRATSRNETRSHRDHHLPKRQHNKNYHRHPGVAVRRLAAGSPLHINGRRVR